MKPNPKPTLKEVFNDILEGSPKDRATLLRQLRSEETGELGMLLESPIGFRSGVAGRSLSSAELGLAVGHVYGVIVSTRVVDRRRALVRDAPPKVDWVVEHFLNRVGVPRLSALGRYAPHVRLFGDAAILGVLPFFCRKCATDSSRAPPREAS